MGRVAWTLLQRLQQRLLLLLLFPCLLLLLLVLLLLLHRTHQRPRLPVLQRRLQFLQVLQLLRHHSRPQR